LERLASFYAILADQLKCHGVMPKRRETEQVRRETEQARPSICKVEEWVGNARQSGTLEFVSLTEAKNRALPDGPERGLKIDTRSIAGPSALSCGFHFSVAKPERSIAVTYLCLPHRKLFGRPVACTPSA
jgi:hypothetical protein